MELLKLRLQFFAEVEDEEEETETPYISEDTGIKTSYDDYMVENNRVDENTYYANNNFLGTQKEWEDYYGYDADRDYQNTVNTLNYEYQTSMANYGEQAEKMYQMGLQNSGVSDIFRANAFSAYLGNMNKAAADRINLKNQYKRDYARYKDDFKKGWTDYDAITQSGYKSYSDNYDSTLKTNAINGYTAVLSSGLFSGEGIEGYESAEGASVGAGFKDYHKVSNYLKNLGYDDVTIEEVWKKLARMDLAGLTTDRVNAGYVNTDGMYDGTTESETLIRTALQAMHLTESEINSVIQRHKDTWNNSEAGKTAAVDTFVTNWTDKFDPNMSKEEFVNQMITKDGKTDVSQRANAEAAWEQMKSNWEAAAPERVQAIVDTFGIGEGKIDPSSFESKEAFINEMVKNNHSTEDAEAAWNRFDEAAGNAYNEVWAKYQTVDDTGALINTYTGNTKQKLDIKNLLGADVPEYIYNEIIKRMDANRAEEKEADKQDTLTGIEDLPEDEVNYNTLYNEIKNSGNDPDIIATSSVKYKDAVMGVLNDDSGKKLANAYKLIPNMTKDSWDALDGAGKLDALLNGMGEVHKNNVLTADDYDNIVEMWATASLEEADIHNMPKIIQMLNNFADKYGLSNETIDSIIRGANVHVRGITPHISSSSDMGAIFVDTNKGNVQIRVRRATRLTDTDKQNMVTLFDGDSYQLVRHSGSNILYYLENGKYYELESNEKTKIMFPVNTVAAEIVDTNVVKGSTGYDPIKGTETNKVVLPDGSEHTIPTGYRVEKLNTGVIMAVPEDGATRERQPIVLYDPDKS